MTLLFMTTGCRDSVTTSKSVTSAPASAPAPGSAIPAAASDQPPTTPPAPSVRLEQG